MFITLFRQLEGEEFIIDFLPAQRSLEKMGQCKKVLTIIKEDKVNYPNATYRYEEFMYAPIDPSEMSIDDNKSRVCYD